ncbi:MAG: hypothetical protein AAF810_13765 [Cyanobacteria bacterium P01_D01_bin.36]
MPTSQSLPSDNSAQPPKAGDRLTVTYADRDFEVIIIDPDGLGKGQPSFGFGFRMAEKYIGIDNTTLSRRVLQIKDDKLLKNPSGKTFRVLQIAGTDGNEYSVIEAGDWFALSADVLVSPGKTRKATKEKVAEFIRWFAITGFYASANIALKGTFTSRDERATQRWIRARESGKPTRKNYTDILHDTGAQSRDYADRTNQVYIGLFGMKADAMKQKWELMRGDPKIARNYISEEKGLEAVKFCEDMVTRLYTDDMNYAHEMAIQLTVTRYDLRR